ncbi:MAG: hypothetical protein EU533_04735 [Promethearchaeota archaeon]|nr:MAG: hypothetical protein EU533_04735 [Candidatus Lokiarchaeota archaeon]
MSFSDIDKDLVDSLLIFYRRIEELRKTRFFNYYKNNPSKVTLNFEIPSRKLEVEESEIDNKNDEFLRSFVAILRLFFLDMDKFSLRYLWENYQVIVPVL